MCGIVGIISDVFSDKTSYMKKSLELMRPRGPDASDFWLSDDKKIALGHRRLSILDLSNHGSQPMISASGRYIIVFNGEIYNFNALKKELIPLGHSFRSSCDTEVILAAIEQWGITTALKKFNGMFAFAVYDKQKRLLFLARDRMGLKPLYYGLSHNSFIFASELKPIKSYPSFDNKLNKKALAGYFQYGYVPSPYSIYENIYKLAPGSLLTFSLNSNIEQKPKIERYWNIPTNISSTKTSEQDLMARLEQLLYDSIKLRLISDVPIGTLLSGGIDSSLITAIAQNISSKPVNSFSIGYEENSYDESEHAAKIAQYLGTKHTTLRVSPEEAAAIIPKLPTLYDEPFADSSQIPTSLVFALAKQHVTVTLSGDGGDELFAGYNRYLLASRPYFNLMQKLPYSLRIFFAKMLAIPSPTFLNASYNQLAPILPKQLKTSMVGEKIHKLANALNFTDQKNLYQKIISYWPYINELLPDLDPIMHDELYAESGRDNFIESMMFWDQSHYLPDDILTKIDRASMGSSVEARVPLLDHHIVELSWQMPLRMKIHNGQTKLPLRQLLSKYIPANLSNKPKMGFAIPIDKWITSSLREWTESLITDFCQNSETNILGATVEKLWKEHLSGRKNHINKIWTILMFQAWFEQQKH
ncbi:MAG: asparagine synthase (glutamine-hydrolyzing) [Gammaproteobacteria bacterium]|nr:asparagine synthase (glutamine-hydrolyzing) [Gammaproteobacteria bacterium]